MQYGTKIALTPIGAIFIKKYGIINLRYSNILLGILNKWELKHHLLE